MLLVVGRPNLYRLKKRKKKKILCMTSNQSTGLFSLSKSQDDISLFLIAFLDNGHVQNKNIAEDLDIVRFFLYISR